MEIQSFLDIEKKYNLYEDEILSVRYWIYIRFYILREELMPKMMQTGKLQDEYVFNKKNSLKGFVPYIWNSFSTKRNIREAGILITNHSRKLLQKNYYRCIYTEWLEEEFDDIVVGEMPYQGNHLKPSQNANHLFYMDEVFVWEYFEYYKKKFFCKREFCRLQNMVRDKVIKILDEIGSVYEIEINAEKVINRICSNIFCVIGGRKYYRKLLLKIRPKMIIEVVHYGREKMLLSEIAHELGIAVVEFQHGTMHTEHIPYQYDYDGKIAQLPDYILTFSDFWNEVARMPMQSTKLYSVGFPYFEEQIRQYRNEKKSQECKWIIFVSQGAIGAQLSKLAVELSACLEESKYKIIYRLHPGERKRWETEYIWLKESKVIVDVGDKESLYAQFGKCDIQVGVYSTAVFEGMGFGLRTIIYNIGPIETMKILVEKGYATMVTNCAELVDAISREQSEMKDVSCFWRDNSKENIKAILNMIRKDKIEKDM